MPLTWNEIFEQYPIDLKINSSFFSLKVNNLVTQFFSLAIDSLRPKLAIRQNLNEKTAPIFYQSMKSLFVYLVLEQPFVLATLQEFANVIPTFDDLQKSNFVEKESNQRAKTTSDSTQNTIEVQDINNVLNKTNQAQFDLKNISFQNAVFEQDDDFKSRLSPEQMAKFYEMLQFPKFKEWASNYVLPTYGIQDWEFSWTGNL